MSEARENEIKEVLPAYLKTARMIAFANNLVGTKGERIKLPLKGRDINAVYYRAESDNAPLIAGFHGGGFLFGGCALDDLMWDAVRNALDVNIISVGYRKSPEYKWDISVNDCYESTLYLSEHAEEFGFDCKHISVMGQSAGGNLAACVAMKCNKNRAFKLDNQILLYPFLDLSRDSDSKGPGSFSGIICYVMDYLHVDKKDTRKPFVSPVYARKSMLQGGPKAVMVFCGLDNLRFEAMRFEKKLAACGVDTAALTLDDMPHSYFEVGFKKRLTDLAIEVLGPNGAEMFESGACRKAAEDTLKFLKKEFVR